MLILGVVVALAAVVMVVLVVLQIEVDRVV